MSVPVQSIPSDRYQTIPIPLVPEAVAGPDALDARDAIADSRFLTGVGATLAASTVACLWMAVTTS